VKTTQILNK